MSTVIKKHLLKGGPFSLRPANKDEAVFALRVLAHAGIQADWKLDETKAAVSAVERGLYIHQGQVGFYKNSNIAWVDMRIDQLPLDDHTKIGLPLPAGLSLPDQRTPYLISHDLLRAGSFMMRFADRRHAYQFAVMSEAAFRRSRDDNPIPPYGWIYSSSDRGLLYHIGYTPEYSGCTIVSLADFDPLCAVKKSDLSALKQAWLAEQAQTAMKPVAAAAASAPPPPKLSLVEAFNTASVCFEPESATEVAQLLHYLQRLGYVAPTPIKTEAALEYGIEVDPRAGSIHVLDKDSAIDGDFYAASDLINLDGESLLRLNRDPLIKMMDALRKPSGPTIIRK